ERGAGKSTLLLCAAGLLVPDTGVVRWFGSRDRDVALRRTTYHFAGAGPITRRRVLPASPHMYLLDGGTSAALAVNARVARLIARRRLCGDVIIVSAHGGETALQLGLRALVLRDGRIPSEPNPSAASRVAERRVSPTGASS